MNEMKLLLADDPDPETLDIIAEVESEAWHIKGPYDRIFAMEVLAKAAFEKARNKSLYDAAKARLDAWLTSREEAIDSGVAYVKAEMERDATIHRAELVKGRSKTIDLPNGTISWRKKGGRLVVTDPEALAKWCVEEGPDKGLYRVKTEADLTKVQALFKATGVLPPGTEYEPEVESITIKPSMPLLPGETT
jgi:phage host-nuclease inhibitor protein Gam